MKSRLVKEGELGLFFKAVLDKYRACGDVKKGFLGAFRAPLQFSMVSQKLYLALISLTVIPVRSVITSSR